MFCAICIDGADDLRRNDEGHLECTRCRTEHPICGGYSFEGGRSDKSIGNGNSKRSSATWQSGGKQWSR